VYAFPVDPLAEDPVKPGAGRRIRRGQVVGYSDFLNPLVNLGLFEVNGVAGRTTGRVKKTTRYSAEPLVRRFLRSGARVGNRSLQFLRES
jgi:hypothetical protein